MEFSTNALVIFGLLSAVKIVCTRVLSTELKVMLKEIKKD